MALRLSVIIPVYNAAKYLRECLDSVLAQTFPDFEVICVDDGSTDESGATLDEYAEKDSRFRIIHQQNTGLSGARNAAIEIARGEWVGFVDADDTIPPNWFADAVDLMRQGDFDLVRLCARGGRYAGTVGQFTGKEAAIWAWQTLHEYGFVWLCFVKWSVVGKVRFRSVINEDGVFWMDLIPRLARVCQGDAGGYYYRPTEGSLSKKYLAVSQCVDYLKAYLDIWDAQKGDVSSLGISDVVRRRLRIGADHIVSEWFHRRRKDRSENSDEIIQTYLSLEAGGALCPEWCHQKRRLKLPFWLWRATGSWIGFWLLEWMERIARRIR